MVENYQNMEWNVQNNVRGAAYFAEHIVRLNHAEEARLSLGDIFI